MFLWIMIKYLYLVLLEARAKTSFRLRTKVSAPCSSGYTTLHCPSPTWLTTHDILYLILAHIYFLARTPSHMTHAPVFHHSFPSSSSLVAHAHLPAASCACPTWLMFNLAISSAMMISLNSRVRTGRSNLNRSSSLQQVISTELEPIITEEYLAKNKSPRQY